MTVSSPETFEQKLQEMLDRVPAGLDKREGSIIYDALAPIALQLWIEEMKLRQILEQAFTVKAEGIYLDYIADDHGLKRIPAAPAKVMLQIDGTPNKVIPAKTTFGILNADISFTTDTEALLVPTEIEETGPPEPVTTTSVIVRPPQPPAAGEYASSFMQTKKVTVGRGLVMATCKQTGVGGNVAANTITLLFDVNSDIKRVTNPEPAKFGMDLETDEDLRNRILYQKRNPEHGGTTSDYVRWALTVTGVTYAKSIDKARGIGSVDVVIGGNESQIDQLIKETQSFLDKKKPSGVDVRVRKLNQQEVDITVKVEGIAKELALTTILAYTRTIGVGGSIYPSKMIAALINAGAADASVLKPMGTVHLDGDSSIKPVVTIL
ncbi:UNVERIFIED_CONTAM: putative phage protein gp47/JayE [Brevibacillus sp. OAP136]